ncbi:MAG: hypothetical protein LBT23_11355, partial [Synergistaceae bacterium]|nr:hypothetical protein [Synergistaceae bacterium]
MGPPGNSKDSGVFPESFFYAVAPRGKIFSRANTQYAEAMKAGAVFLSVIVFNDGSDHWLADGFHRIYAAISAGFPEIEADVREGAVRDARRCAMGANDTHGLRATNADKRNGVLIALDDDKWSLLSNYELADFARCRKDLSVKSKKNGVRTVREVF